MLETVQTHRSPPRTKRADRLCRRGWYCRRSVTYGCSDVLSITDFDCPSFLSFAPGCLYYDQAKYQSSRAALIDEREQSSDRRRHSNDEQCRFHWYLPGDAQRRPEAATWIVRRRSIKYECPRLCDLDSRSEQLSSDTRITLPRIPRHSNFPDDRCNFSSLSMSLSGLPVIPSRQTFPKTRWNTQTKGENQWNMSMYPWQSCSPPVRLKTPSFQLSRFWVRFRSKVAIRRIKSKWKGSLFLYKTRVFIVIVLEFLRTKKTTTFQFSCDVPNRMFRVETLKKAENWTFWPPHWKPWLSAIRIYISPISGLFLCGETRFEKNLSTGLVLMNCSVRPNRSNWIKLTEKNHACEQENKREHDKTLLNLQLMGQM